MSGASANRADLRRVKESVWGETPANPALSFTRNTGFELNNDITTERSQEIRPDRTLADLINVDASVSGSINFEFSYGSYDDLIEAALMSTWVNTTVIGAAGDISTVAAVDDNLVSTTTDKFEDIVVGQVIELRGFGAVNGLYRVRAKADNETLTLFPAPASAVTPANAEGSVVGDYIKNGILEQSFSLIKRFNDASPVARQLFRGMRVGSFNLDMSTASLITGSFNMMGAEANWIAAEPTGATNITAPTTPVMNAVTNITDIQMDDTALCASGAVANLTFELDNQHREQKGLCRLGSVGIVAGQLAVNWSGSQYFRNSDEAERFENSGEFEFSITLTDNLGNRYVITTFRNKYETFTANPTGLDTDVMAEVSFTGLYDPVTDAVIMISRIPAPTP